MKNTGKQQHRCDLVRKIPPPGLSAFRLMAIGATAACVAATATFATGTASAAPSGSERFHMTRSVEYFCVPTGVTTMTIEAVGGAGTTLDNGGIGGDGARVVGTFPVAPGTELAVTVGQWGHDDGGYGDGRGGRHGTADGLSGAYSGGGGGGSTAVKSTTHACGVRDAEGATYLVVAGGGGGAGGNSDNTGGREGGHGGDAGRLGSAGHKGEAGGDGGCGGRAPGDGCNESKDGGRGTDGAENPEGGAGGGGGGGGLNGGGRGHADGLSGGPAGGGGGGASYAAPTGTNVFFSPQVNPRRNSDGFVRLSWGDGATAPGSGGSSVIFDGMFGSS